MHKRTPSLSTTLALILLVVSLALIALNTMINGIVAHSLNTAFSNIDEVVAYREALRQDDYAAIPERAYRNGGFIVFGEDNETLYATDRTILEEVYASDVDLILEPDANLYYNVFEKIGPNGERNHLVFLISYDVQTGEHYVYNSSTLNENYEIVDGTLFAEHGKLTKRQFELLRGIYQSGRSFEKYSYLNDLGEWRNLVFASRVVTESSYNQAVESANRVWLLAIPFLLLVVLISVYLFIKRFRKSIQPLNDAIASYQEGSEVQIDTSQVPSEFHETIEGFSNLTSRVATAKKETEEAQSEKQRVFANISHDLKTPLTVIQGYSGAFLDGLVPEQKQREYHQAIHDKSVLATELIDSLFNYAKLEHPDYKIVKQTVDFTEFLKQYIASKYADIEFQGFQMDIDIPEEKAMLSIDENLMRRLFNNLIDNALKYNPPGTTIFVHMANWKREIQVRIADDGVGIPPSIAVNAFQPFVTGNTSRAAGKGTGLGLTIAAKIVNLHRGDIELTPSDASKYATEILIRLPKTKMNP